MFRLIFLLFFGVGFVVFSVIKVSKKGIDESKKYVDGNKTKELRMSLAKIFTPENLALAVLGFILLLAMITELQSCQLDRKARSGELDIKNNLAL